MSENLVKEFEEQEGLTAVEKFAVQHDLRQIPQDQHIYEELIPKKNPGPGQQYAFEVNLDQCTGCKACVVACHHENGLEEDETWRSVGLIHGGTTENPVIQHVTSSCHHCLEPGCLTGCPVNAYEKDKDTGIVKHLDDQCIGCQYCTFTCPYDVPKYIPKKGIVHKCDMCISRLKVGEAPACVRACPNGAIRITLIEKGEVKENPKEFVNIPDAPDPHYTRPTTRYLHQKEFPGNTISMDFYSIKPAHSHIPLVLMLVLTQLSVGTFFVILFLKDFIRENLHGATLSFYGLVGFNVGLLALLTSIFHLGRPLYAFRSVIGIKHSWLSREIVVFGVFAMLAMVYASSFWMDPLRKFWGVTLIEKNVQFYQQEMLLVITTFVGALGVLCSVMVYKVTHRPFWDHPMTTMKFFLTTGILGLSTILITTMISIIFFPSGLGLSRVLTELICRLLFILTALKLISEMTILIHLGDREITSLKKTAILLIHPLRSMTLRRLFYGIVGGIFLPFVLILKHMEWGVERLVVLSFLIFIYSFVGEFLERYLFFKAVVPLKMPGGVQSS